MKTKLIFTKFLGITFLAPLLFLSLCDTISSFFNSKFNKDEKTDNEQEYNPSYFLNLLEKHYEEFNAKNGTFSGLNLFYNQPYKQREKYLFLGNQSKQTIEKPEQFQKIIIDKTNEVLKNNPDFEKITSYQLKWEFEEKFLILKTMEQSVIIIWIIV
ncbi:hypothetical protein [Mesomycoplasma dispar]|uniref:Lipoprotein n=1 Tax=Mesomycoplasma dispar TaxID=86660 RepID=A0ABN5DUP5_9BACT|nr:hypothetical protein [Mesomycoplasma dispar]ATP59757.1 hypothetical protein CSW10_02315 [Mesomycoplasma dispar]